MVLSLTKPVIIPQPMAVGGQHADIPNNATGTNRASFQEGWPEITSKPIDDGGIPPNRLDFNGLAFITTTLNYFLQNGGAFTFDIDISNAIGGYPKGAILWVFDATGNPSYAVRSMIGNNVANFVSNPALIDGVNWKKMTLDAGGDAMAGTLPDQMESQVRNIKIVAVEPATGVDGTIYAIME